MSDFNVTILGCGSAKPTLRHYTTAQIVTFHNNLFLVDCGEGVQRSMLKSKISMAKIGHIFLSHLHGDHCLGLVGLISTLGLSQRQGRVVIHAEKNAEKIFRPLFNFFCPELSMEVEFQAFNPETSEKIYETDSIEVITIPLKHRVPTCGFLFKEKPKKRHLIPDKLEEYNISTAYFNKIASGSDWSSEDGKVIPNTELTTDPSPSKSYAYVSDTMYSEAIVPIIKDCDVLYHEATFMHEMVETAKQRGHSTALEAAKIANQANAKQLILGHFSSRYNQEGEELLLNEAKSVFLNTILAKEQLSIEI